MLRMITVCLAILSLPSAMHAQEFQPVKLTSAQIEQIKRATSKGYIDPDSLKFRDIHASDVTRTNGKKVRRVCGEVNGKNAYGGYVGYTFFGGIMKNGVFKKRDFAMPCRSWK